MFLSISREATKSGPGKSLCRIARAYTVIKYRFRVIKFQSVEELSTYLRIVGEPWDFFSLFPSILSQLKRLEDREVPSTILVPGVIPLTEYEFDFLGILGRCIYTLLEHLGSDCKLTLELTSAIQSDPRTIKPKKLTRKFAQWKERVTVLLFFCQNICKKFWNNLVESHGRIIECTDNNVKLSTLYLVVKGLLAGER